MNPLYERTSRRCDVGQIDAALRAKIAAHAEAHQLGDVLHAAVACCVTTNVLLQKPGLLSRLIGVRDAEVPPCGWTPGDWDM